MSLTIAGHTHGGQVRLPFYGRPIRTSEFGYDAGPFVKQGHDLFVTTGIGTSIMDVRFNVPPEIVILTLTGLVGPAPNELDRWSSFYPIANKRLNMDQANGLLREILILQTLHALVTIGGLH